MNSAYLQAVGESLYFIDGTDFQQQLEQLDFTVPSRKDGRRSFHRERYCLLKYLVALASSDSLRWPVTVVKFERPDFLFIDNSGKLIGIEQADFGSRANQRQLSMLQAGKIPSIPPVLDTGPNSGQVGAPKDEEPFARFALAVILRKTRLIARSSYSPCDELRLLLYPNTGLENVSIPKVSGILLDKWQRHISHFGLQQPFSSIGIIYGSDEVWLDFALQSRTPQLHTTHKSTTSEK